MLAVKKSTPKKEPIINAFCHRDYYEYDSVNVAIFKDRVEIRSPGALYGGLTISQIRKRMVSRRRNELIAEMFHEVHLVEKWGRGISLILSKEPDAEFEVVAEIFITRFKRKSSRYAFQNPLCRFCYRLQIRHDIHGICRAQSKIGDTLGLFAKMVKTLTFCLMCLMNAKRPNSIDYYTY